MEKEKTQEDHKSEEINVDIVKIEGNAMLFNNTVYQISNISSFYFVDYKITHKHDFPYLIFFLIAVSVICGAMLYGMKNDISIVVQVASEIRLKKWVYFAGLIVPVLITLGILADYKSETYTYKHGLGVMLNSGYQNVFLSKNKEFIKELVGKLYSVLATDEDKKILINFKDESINIENVSNSNVIAGDAKGNVYNNMRDSRNEQ